MSCGIVFVGIEQRDGEPVAHLLVGGHDEYYRTPDEVMAIAQEAQGACAALVVARAREMTDAAQEAKPPDSPWSP